MVGIGTDKVDLMACQYKYSSLLGLDNQSWGYSYRGLAQHNGRLKYYGKRYSSLCIVGVYLGNYSLGLMRVTYFHDNFILDLRRRSIEFYLNRRLVLLSSFLMFNYDVVSSFFQTTRYCLSSAQN